MKKKESKGRRKMSEPNDTVFDATYTGIFGSGFFSTSAEIGDNPNLFFAEDDVDLYEVQLNAGNTLIADVDADIFGSQLDSILTLFDYNGFSLAQNDDDFGSLDSFLEYTAGVSDIYYVGVSSYDNFNYDPFVEGSGSGNSSGFYDLFIDVV